MPDVLPNFKHIFLPHETKDKIVLTILDNGVGIPEAQKDKLFKLFGCLKETRKMNAKGVGLGLYISKMITEEFGGVAQMFSQVNTGSIFQSSFTLEKVTRSLQESICISPSSQSSNWYLEKIKFAEEECMAACLANYKTILDKLAGDDFFTSKKILLVDDESYNCQAIFHIIKSLKLPNCVARINKAYSGKQALKLVK